MIPLKSIPFLARQMEINQEFFFFLNLDFQIKLSFNISSFWVEEMNRPPLETTDSLVL